MVKQSKIAKFFRWLNAGSEPKQADPQEDRARVAANTLGGVLNEYGRHAFDLENIDAGTIESECNAWAQHVTGHAAAPTAPHGSKHAIPTDWSGLTNYFRDRRKGEQRYVESGMSVLRNDLWKMIEMMSRILSDEFHVGERMNEQLVALRASADARSIDDLRRAVALAVSVLDRTLADREHRYQEQLRIISSQLGGLHNELERTRKELAVDPLTRLFNRTGFDRHIEKLLWFKQLSGQPASLLMVDLDHFKVVNDTYGHLAGDAVLREFADLCVRTFPRKLDFVARYGGEEIAVLLEDDAKIAQKLGQKLIETARAHPFEFEGSRIDVTCSIGLATLQRGNDVNAWIARADEALYAAKDAGRDRLVDLDQPDPRNARRAA